MGPTGIGSSVPVVHLGYNTTVIHTNRIFSAVGFCPSDQMIAIGAMWSLTTPTGPPTDINTPLQIWSSGIALDVSGNPGAAWELRGVYAFPSGNDGPDLELILQPICIDATLVPAT